jgi:hypothetical protein
MTEGSVPVGAEKSGLLVLRAGPTADVVNPGTDSLKIDSLKMEGEAESEAVLCGHSPSIHEQAPLVAVVCTGVTPG